MKKFIDTITKVPSGVNGTFFALLGVAFLVFVVTGLTQAADAGFIAFLVGAGACFFRLYFWRCPHCKSFLGQGFSLPRFCPSCGKELNPEEGPDQKDS